MMSGSEPGNRPIRVLLVVDSFGLGGAQTLINEIVKHADPARFAITVCSLGRDTVALADRGTYGAGLVVLGARRWNPFVVCAVKRWIRKIDVDVVHCHLTKSVLIGAQAVRGTRARLVAHNHLDLTDNWLGGILPGPLGAWLSRGLMRRALGRADAVIAVAHVVADRLRTFHMADGRPVHVVMNGIDLAKYDCDPARRRMLREETRKEFGFPPDSLILTNASRFFPQKNWPAFLRAVDAARRVSERVRGLAIGDGPTLAETQKTAAEMNLRDTIAFPGFRRDVPRLLLSSDVLLFPSVEEGDSLTIKEAMAAGLPVVAFAAGDMRRAVRDGLDGCVVDIGAEAELQERLCRVVTDAGLREQFGRSARERAVAEFGVQRTVAQIEDILAQVCSTRASE